MMDETDNLVSADPSEPHYVTRETSKPERLEDVFQDEIIIAFTNISRFKMFARSNRGLCLDDHVMQDIEDKGTAVDQKLELLYLWKEKSGEEATVGKIRKLVASYKKGDDPEDNSRQNIPDVGVEGIDCSTTHNIESALNFQPTINNSRQDIPDGVYDGIDCSTTHNIEGASNFQATISQREDSGFQKQNERADSWKKKFVVSLIISIVLVAALTVTLTLICTTAPVVSKKTQEKELRIDELNEQIQNLTQEKDSAKQEMEIPIDELNEQLKEKDSETREMELRIDELTEQIQNLTQERDSVAPEFIIYEKNCFWKEVHASMDTTVTEASKICTDKNSRLADIYSEEHYNMIMNYIRTDHSVAVWTGMRKQYQNPKAILSDGRTAPFTKPRSSGHLWNTARSTYTHVYLYVQSDASQTYQGMTAYPPTASRHGALCQSL